MNRKALCTCLADVLAPKRQPGETVVMGKLPAHKVYGVHKRIVAVGARLFYLPAYTPDIDPIDTVSATLKALLCSPAARTIVNLWDAIRLRQRYILVENID